MLLSKLFSKFNRLITSFRYSIIKWHYRKTRTVTKRGLTLNIHPTVFHPTYYLSTDILLDYIRSLKLEDKHILELGAGNGLISLFLAKNSNNTIYSSDINHIAVEGLIENAKTNNVVVETFHSDLFDEIPALPLNYIFVNPPYFQREIKTVDEYAFFVGPNYEYFKKFYKQVTPYLKLGTVVILILSENVDMVALNSITKEYNLSLNTIFNKIVKKEEFIIYNLTML